MVKRSRQGFTALEVSVVVSMILVLSAFILPHLVNRRSSESDRAFVVALNRVSGQAREGAILDNRIYHLQMDGEQTLVIRKEDENGNLDTTEPVATISVPDGLAPDQYVLGGKTTNLGDWDVRFFPDGTSDQAGISFLRGTDRTSLNIDEKAHGSTSEELTDTTTERWDAGSYEQRQ